MKLPRLLLLLIIFSLSFFLSIQKTSGWIISSLEMIKLRWAFNTSKTFMIYFPNIWQWLTNLSQHGVGQFSLNYIFSAPLLFIFGEEIGFKIFFAIVGGLNAVLVYLFLNKIFLGYKGQQKSISQNITRDKLAVLASTLILVLSFGFISISGLLLMDPSMTFFLILALFFFIQRKYFLFASFLTIAALCKMPVLAIIPGLGLYIFLYQKKLFLNKGLLLSGISGLLLFIAINKLVVSDVTAPLWLVADAIPLPKALGSFKFVHLRNLFVTAPVLTITGILGLFSLNSKERKKLLPIIFSIFSLMFFYFSSRTVGFHYNYFLYPILAIFGYFFLKNLSLKYILVLFLINLVVFYYSYKEEPVFTRFKKSNLPQLAEIIKGNLQEKEFILTHHGVWDYYFWKKPYTVIKEIEWYGNVDISESNIPKGYIDNTGILILRRDHLNQLHKWPYFDQFQLEREIDNWYIFVRKRGEEINI